MSKYIKLEGLKWHSPDESLVKPLTEFYITESDIADLPTIEVGEDAISREDLIESFLADCECESREEARAATLNLEDMLELIDDAPSVVPSRADGEWLKDEYDIPRCSECNCVNNTVYRSYCPNCGAKMKGAE